MSTVVPRNLRKHVTIFLTNQNAMRHFYKNAAVCLFAQAISAHCSSLVRERNACHNKYECLSTNSN